MGTNIRKAGIYAIGLMLIVGFFGISVPVQAELDETVREDIAKLQDEIRSRKEAVAKIEEKIDTAKKSIERKRIEALSLQNQIEIIEGGLDAVRLDIQVTRLEIETVELELEKLRLEIAEMAEEIEQHKKFLAELIRTLHRESERGYLELLLSQETLSEFFSQAHYLEEVYKDMGQEVRGLRDTKHELQIQEGKLDEKQTSLQELNTALAAKEDELTGQKDYKERLIVETKESEQLFQKALSELREEYQRIENEMQSIERAIRAKLEGSDKLSGLGEVILSWPVPSRYITSYFHDPDYPFRHVFEHGGMDIRAGLGTAVRAAAPGFVARAKRCESAWCYSYVMIIHGGNVSTVYGHFSEVAVSEDEFVGRGDVIGYSGGTPGTAGAGPFVTGPHLHFETRLNGIPVNPLDYLL